MSSKDYFGKATTIQALANKSAEEIASEIESVGYQTQDIIREERFMPRVNYYFPRNFARYGSAEEYYSQALNRIASYYPYDGSLKERLEWENESTYLDLYIFDQQYPRTNGYVNLSATGWGDGTITETYGAPATPEYIYFEGGPHPNPHGMSPYSTQFSGSNYYEPSLNRESNLKFDLRKKGVSIEFWLKKDAFDVSKTEKEVIFDLWNGETPGSVSYGRLRLELTGNVSTTAPFRLTVMSGTVGFETKPLGSSAITTSTVADGNWHHYTVALKSVATDVNAAFYVDGNLDTSASLSVGGSKFFEVAGALRATIGALITTPTTGSSVAAYAGKLSASLDEFRYWKTERTGKDVGRFWFTQVGGGTNDDPKPFIQTTEEVNTNLGIYYKFNEGITGIPATDAVVLDYSGRLSNGAWTGYGASSRSTGSAIVLSNAATKEFKDPIIRTSHPAVRALATSLQITGSVYDASNNASMYNSFPSWITEEDSEGQRQLKNLTQILSSYFDTLHMQVEQLAGLKDIQYPRSYRASPPDKPLPFAERLLNSAGLITPDLFIDADILEKLADRSEDRVYEKSLTDVKNTIYQNIYNNLVYIYKTKGTEKSFRNLIRAFGIDDELVKLNMYGNGIEYEIRNNRRDVSVADRFIDFNTEDNQYASVYQYQNSRDAANTTGFIPANTHLTGGYASTLETDILFPLKLTEDSKYYFDTNTMSASLFGVHTAEQSQDTLTWESPDRTNFQVYAVRDELYSDNAQFILTGTEGGYVPRLSSPLFEDVYNNTHWNLAVRVKPENFPRSGLVAGAWGYGSGSYTIELHGTQIDAGVIRNEFTVSGTVNTPHDGFITGSKRTFIGAHRTNYTGDVRESSDIKVNACRYWLDYLDDETLRGHAYDTQNYGSLRPNFYAYPFEPGAPYGEVLKSDTLLFNWEFALNTGSNASGQFMVADEYGQPSGSNPTRFGALGDILNKQYTERGDKFPASSTKVVDKDFMVASKLQLPENVQSSQMVQVLSAQDQQIFARDSRPVNYFFAFEKSMAQAISVEMINYFATLKDINNIIGAPVNKYRPEYKGLKILRQRFFERVSNNEIDFEKFYEFYKWFDSSLTVLLQQLVPASADFAENVRTTIESHMLERSKYQNKIQNVKSNEPSPDGTADGVDAQGSMMGSPENDPQGTGFYSMNAFSRRQVGSSQPMDYRWWQFTHAPTPRTIAPLARSLEFNGDAGGGSNESRVDIEGSAATWNSLIGGSGSLGKPFSVSMWARASDVSTATLFSVGDNLGGAYNGRTVTLSTYVQFTVQNGLFAYGGSLSNDQWYHITCTYSGGNAGVPRIYIDGSEISYTGQFSNANPLDITGNGITLGNTWKAAGSPDFLGDFPGYMCDFAVYSKELSAGEVSQLYNGGKRLDILSLNFIASSVLAWFQLGDRRDTYNGPIYDQVGNFTGSSIDQASDALDNTESPPIRTPYSGPAINQNNLWWTYRAERGNTVISSSMRALNIDKQVLLAQVANKNVRTQKAPVKFGAEGHWTLGGVGFNQNKKVNFVYTATTPFGSVRDGAPENVIAGFGSDVEKLIETVDIYHPAYKQRLGFFMDPDINRDNGSPLKADGNLLLPFSIYSSSVASGHNQDLIDNYAPNIEITNLHHDLVYNSDIPMQGPFTKKFVGGRQARHTELNTGSDDASNRGEAFKLEISSKELSVVSPNYNASNVLGYEKNVPTAHRLRNVGTKRPVNIQNIKMTTASADFHLEGTLAHSSIGNYQKNYQVVMSNARTKNDPFFNDQSFSFALHPETLSTRGRMPLGAPVHSSMYFHPGTGDRYATGSTILDISNTVPDTQGAFANINTCYSGKCGWNLKIGGADTPGSSGITTKPFTISFWMKPTGTGETTLQSILTMGRPAGSGIHIYTRQDLGYIYCQRGTTSGSYYLLGGGISLNQWTHVIATFSGDATTARALKFYINGELHANSPSPATKDDIADITGYPLGRVASIGGKKDADSSYEGYLCDFAFWTKEFSASEASEIYNNGFRMNLERASASSDLLSWFLLGDGLDRNSGARDGSPNLAGLARAFDHQAFVIAAYGGQTANVTAYVDPPEIRSESPFSQLIAPTMNPGGSLKYELPNRVGTGSNESIIVNRFAGSGYEVMSRGYMDPAHEEMSVYNALPYHNLSIINYGLSGSASVDPSIADRSGSLTSMVVLDQLGKHRGLDQRATLHCGPFGSDAAYGSVPQLTYVIQPSFYKVNRNARTRLISGSTPSLNAPGNGAPVVVVTASVYDNWYVQHQIPQSEQQYSWITASLAAGEVIYGLQAPSAYSASTLTQLITASDWGTFRTVQYPTQVVAPRASGAPAFAQGDTPDAGVGMPLIQGFIPINFVGLSNAVKDPLTASSHTLGFPPSTHLYGEAGTSGDQYRNWLFVLGQYTDYLTVSGINSAGAVSAPLFNSLILGRNGPYGYPTWKQVRTGEHKVARALRRRNLISAMLPLQQLPVRNTGSTSPGQSLGPIIRYDRALRQDKFVDYVEQPVVSTNKPISFAFEDNDANPDPANNFTLYVSYQNNLDYFSHEGLNNRLNLAKTADEGNAYNTITEFALNSNLSFITKYGQTIYPKQTNMYRTQVRSREKYNISDIWDDCPTKRWAGDAPIGPDIARINTCENALIGLAENKLVRAFEYGPLRTLANSQNINITGASIWPLDYAYSASVATKPPEIPTQGDGGQGSVTYGWFLWKNSETGSMRSAIALEAAALDPLQGKGNAAPAGELMNSYCRFVFPGKILNGHKIPALPAGNTKRSSHGLYTYNLFLQTYYAKPAGGPGGYPANPPLATAASYVMPIFGGNRTPPAARGPWSVAAGASNPNFGRSLYRNGTFDGQSITAIGQVPWTAPVEMGNSEFDFPRPIGVYKVPYWGRFRGAPPYQEYAEVCNNFRYMAKDHTIVPEFRISTHLENFVEKHNSNFLDTPPNLFELTGSSHDTGNSNIPTLDNASFYNTYSTADFMKYFKVIDNDFSGKTNAASIPVQRDSLELTCDAVLQFIPYKGFYPAERTVELASLLSKSLGEIEIAPYALMNSASIDDKLNGGILKRILLEPLIAPGILFNTIKSGIAVSNFVVGNCIKPSDRALETPDNGLYPLTEFSEVSNYPLVENLLRTTGSTAIYGDRAGANWIYNIQADGLFSGDEGGATAPTQFSRKAVTWLQDRGVDGLLGGGPVDYDFAGFRPDSQNIDAAAWPSWPHIPLQGNTSTIGHPTLTRRNTGSYGFPLLNLATLEGTTNYLAQINSGYDLPVGGINPVDIAKDRQQELMTGGYFFKKIPFEAVRDPEKYLGKDQIFNEWLYDTGLGISAIHNGASALAPAAMALSNSTGDIRTKIKYSGRSRSPLYKMAIDNFLCATYSFFLNGPQNTTFLSRQEEEFLPVTSGSFYGMQVTLAVPERWGIDTILNEYGSSSVDMSYQLAKRREPVRKFGMYSRASAFGAPIAMPGFQGTDTTAPSAVDNRMIWSYEHVLPPYFYGTARANILFKAEFDGHYTLDDILAACKVTYQKDSFWGGVGNVDTPAAATEDHHYPLNYRMRKYDQAYQLGSGDYYLSASANCGAPSGSAVAAKLPYNGLLNQITSSVNIFEKLMVIPEGTSEQESRWMIQPKFECPVLNFYNTTANPIGVGSGSTGTVFSTQTNARTTLTSSKNPYLEIRGMWHQYGSAVVNNKGITLGLQDLPEYFVDPTSTKSVPVKSLRELVGFDVAEKQVGQFAASRKVEEAVVCIPFLSVEGNRKFFGIDSSTKRYIKQLGLLNKYIFPPSFDYIINPTVDPIAFYAFEFNLEFDQEDLMNIWQNMPPKSYLAQKFQTATIEIRIRDLIDRLLETDIALEWLVFKVKKRVDKDYNVYVKKNLIEGTPIVEPSLDSPYSYNWPYDYFSIVELIKIDASTVYATKDLITGEDEEVIIPPDLEEFIPLSDYLARNRRPAIGGVRDARRALHRPTAGDAATGQAYSPGVGGQSMTNVPGQTQAEITYSARQTKKGNKGE